jgi:MarR family 2-MHQ and catechol resistance regulon transcriptional repressor
MKPNLQEEIKQTKPFGSLQEELWLNLSRTTAMVGHVIEQKLRSYGLSPTQYNVLRILRGAGTNGLCQYEIGERLVAQVPDVPRIVERMEKAGWVQRVRGVADRRVVMASLTDTGLALAAELDQPTLEIAAEIFGEMSDDDMRRLIDLLVAARRTGGNG